MPRTFSYWKLASLAVIASAVIAGCAEPPAQQTGEGGEAATTGTITVKGSDTMVVLGQKWAEVYQEKNPGVRIQVTGGGSGTGIAALINGTTDIAQSSRPIKDKEREDVKAKSGKEVYEVPVAKDGIAVYVHKDNKLEQISMSQLKDVYTGKITNWKDLGGPDAPIILYSRENNSGTYVFFKEHVLDDEDYSPRAQNMPGTASVVNAVTKDPNGIGYGGIAYGEGVKVLKVKADDQSEAWLPDKEHILSGEYPISRDLYIYTIGEPVGIVKAYIDWCISDEGQKVAEEAEYIPLR